MHDRAAATRSRSLSSLFAGVAVSATGYLAVVTSLPLVSEDLLGSPRFSGVPSAVAILGTAFGTTWLGRRVARRGPRAGLALGYTTSALAALAAAGAAAFGLFALLLASIFAVGAGFGASRLSRYAAAALSEPSRRAQAISWNVWAGTIGSVLGPMLLEPTRQLALATDVAPIAGPFLLSVVTFGVAALVLRAGLPPVAPSSPGSSPTTHGRHDAGVVWTAGFRTALAGMVVGQVVMVLIMTMTPVHIRHEGHGLGSIGVVFAAHTFGMYALSPLSGYFSDRIGRVPVLLASAGLLAIAALLAATARGDTFWLAVALFLLGLGWNFSFVAGSALLTESVPAARRVELQGYGDSAVWVGAAIAGASSGVLLDEIGYEMLAGLGAGMVLVPACVLVLVLGRLAGGPSRGLQNAP